MLVLDVQATKESLDNAISICGPGVEFKKIGKVIRLVAHGLFSNWHSSRLLASLLTNLYAWSIPVCSTWSLDKDPNVLVVWMCTYHSDVADNYGYGVVEHFVGHGVGRVFHSAPSIVHARKFLSVY